MSLQIGQKVIVDGCLWDCKPASEYDYRNAEGVVVEITSGWPVIKIGGERKKIAWDHIKDLEK